MKIKLKYLVGINILLFFPLLIYSVMYLNTPRESRDSSNLKHIMVMLPDSTDDFIIQLKQGLETKAKEYQLILEMENTKFKTLEEIHQYLEISAYAKIDGVMLYGVEDKKIEETIQHLTNLKVPVITIVNDMKQTSRDAFIGVSAYEIGKNIGDILKELTVDIDQVNILDNQFVYGGEAYQTRLLEGILLHADIGNKINRIIKNNDDTLETSEIVENIFRKSQQGQVIICSTAADTLSVARFVVDRKMVGQVVIIGYGMQQELIEYVEKDIVNSIIYGNGYKIGEMGIEVLAKVMADNKQIQTESILPLTIINKNNVSDYKKVQE